MTFTLEQIILSLLSDGKEHANKEIYQFIYDNYAQDTPESSIRGMLGAMKYAGKICNARRGFWKKA